MSLIRTVTKKKKKKNIQTLLSDIREFFPRVGHNIIIKITTIAVLLLFIRSVYSYLINVEYVYY